MIKVSQQIQAIIKESPYLEEGLALGIINLSALARQLKPKIENKSLKKTSVSAIVMALQRMGRQLRQKTKQRKIILPKDLVVRSNLVELTYANSHTLRQKHPQILKLAEDSQDIFFNVLQGIFETSIIASQSLFEQLKQLLKNEKLLLKIENLAAITLRFSEESLQAPGVYYFILKNLAWEGINVIEVISIHNELSMIVEQSKMDKTFSIVKGLIGK